MKPSIPKGTRDFIPAEVYKRKYIFSVIEEVFKKYGYQPIETPAMELLQTLTGKYGEEGDKLLFRVLNNGDFLARADGEALARKDSGAVLPDIARRGLRYDLTVPFARFVVMNRNNLVFPFKRYQIQPVWRADRPQKGRYQEFWQCDADVVGSDSLMYEAEILQIIEETFRSLGIQIRIKLNNRKILNGIAEVFNVADRFMDMTIAIDKLDKIGVDGVIAELTGKGIPESDASRIVDLVRKASLDTLEEVLHNNPTGMQGIREVQMILSYLGGGGTASLIDIDISLARGLNYYTGCIIEVVADSSVYADLSMGSLSGGGRYDNLTEVFGMAGNSGVGISFGADRIYDVMEILELYPANITQQLDILFVTFDEKGHEHAFNVVSRLRKLGIKADLYPDPGKMKKQMKYADARQVPLVGIIGDNEMEKDQITVKEMATGHQQMLEEPALVDKIMQRGG